jgi:hypothetical protein
MYIYKDDAKKLMASLHSEMLGELESKFEFLQAVLDEDDWSFTIKLHALIEAVSTQLIINNINDERLRAMVERLPLSGDEISKLRIAKDLSLYSKGQRAFIRRLSGIRNDIVHNVAKLDFTFSQYVAELDSSAKRAWQDALCWFHEEKDVSEYWRKASLEQPKLAVWMSAFMLVALALVDANQVRANRKIQGVSEATSSKILKDLFNEPRNDA